MSTESRNIRSVVEAGHSGLGIDIECHMSRGLPVIVIVGYANKAVDEAKERIRSAFSSSKLELPRKRITINLAPADIPKQSTGLDLAIALAIIQASSENLLPLSATAVIGELGLQGDVRPVRGIIGKLLAGKAQGFDGFIIPAGNLEQAQLVPGVRLFPVATLAEAGTFLADRTTLTSIDTSSTPATVTAAMADTPLTLDDVIGQELAKRAVEISAAGGHNVLLGGPPGTGKSMLAQALPDLLPPLTRDEMLEVTHLYSLASNDFNRLVTVRPFRAPHHSASTVSITGGGAQVRPGEMSLSHRGVLLFDEFPEFGRSTIEALRQPLETRTVTVARAKETADFPAHFIFVATANPCPCGYYQTTKTCRCTPHQIQLYRRKLSGPILDRIDLYADVHEIDNSHLLAPTASASTVALVGTRIVNARARQAARFPGTSRLNADMSNRELQRHARLSSEAKAMLDTAAEGFGLSPRAYMRSVKVARTIADLDDVADIAVHHVAEALQYRPHAYHEG